MDGGQRQIKDMQEEGRGKKERREVDGGRVEVKKTTTRQEHTGTGSESTVT